jgi:tRNA nucleotidyltransferase (CCA-adding enzyme)
MSSSTVWDALRLKILDKIVPEEKEKKIIKKFSRRIKTELSIHLETAGFKALVEVHGSIAHGTWLSGERDLDIFIILDKEHKRQILLRVLDEVKRYLGKEWREAYAEHPYLIAEIEGYNLDIVPCFKVDPKEGLVSATDRTPLHTGYVKKHLSHEQENEVRLLKRFIKGVGVYGAEVRVGGFSGYLCELLIIAYRNFEGVLDWAATLGKRTMLDLKSASDSTSLLKKFRDPLVVLDPVDPNRNVASAVSETSYWTLSAAARAFLETPQEIFFYPEKSTIESNLILESIDNLESSLLFITVEDADIEVPDVLWGQLYKSERALWNFLEKASFNVLRSGVWSDEVGLHVFIFEFDSLQLPPIVKRKGPPVEMAEEGKRFLNTYIESEDTVSGPWIEGHRWWVETKRKIIHAREFIEIALLDGGRNIGVSKGIADRIKMDSSILFDIEIEKHLNPNFAIFLDEFLKGRPAWIE